MRLYLPFHRPNEDSPAQQVPDNGLTVLLVEDERDVREVTSDQLRELGYRVLEADSGAAALRIVQAGAPFDLLLTDVGLPGGMHGRQLADLVRLRYPALPVILMTGYAAPELTAGMEVICKPFEPEELADLIRARLEAAAKADRK